jgi:hypothetical protein
MVEDWSWQWRWWRSRASGQNCELECGWTLGRRRCRSTCGRRNGSAWGRWEAGTWGPFPGAHGGRFSRAQGRGRHCGRVRLCLRRDGPGWRRIRPWLAFLQVGPEASTQAHAPSHGLINPPSLTYGPSNVLRNCGPRQFTATNEQYMAHGSLHGSEHNSTGQLWPLLSSLKNLCVVFDWGQRWSFWGQRWRFWII